ncbi:MAG TPA: DUF305 domain-containing protein [Vicinamibacterales bacterium]|nr:DUF305 domain-containing protein [Vicinamibacterales bacterium]
MPIADCIDELIDGRLLSFDWRLAIDPRVEEWEPPHRTERGFSRRPHASSFNGSRTKDLTQPTATRLHSRTRIPISPLNLSLNHSNRSIHNPPIPLSSNPRIINRPMPKLTNKIGILQSSIGKIRPEWIILDHKFQAMFRLCLAWVVLLIGACVSLASCQSGSASQAPLVQPGAPGQATRTITPAEAAALPQPRHGPADVRFMQGMIAHHAQALEMTALVPARTSRAEMRRLAQRIEVSQADEIRMMQRWLEDRGERLPDRHAHHAHGAELMPGMLTTDEMGRLAAANGDDFDRLFLELMVKHHEGALIMVDRLFATDGAGQDAEIHAFASDVDADQRMEINRMQAMLGRR